MIEINYYQDYEKNFWQWEDNGEVLAIPNGNTIVYRQIMDEILYQLAPQGLPSFGCLILAVIATNNYASKSFIDKLLFDIQLNHNSGKSDNLKNAVLFLEKITLLPNKYKTGKERIIMLQTIFENCHNMISSKQALGILNAKIPEKKLLNSYKLFIRELKVLSLLNKKFPTSESIVEKISNLPLIEEDIFLEKNIETDNEGDFIDLLEKNDKTFHVGALIKQIWSGLNIPYHNSLPSSQPMGGVSDLTTKGNYDQLVITEFANDDLVFMSRLANNEALFIERETPPQDNDFKRIILIDISLKNWGTPKNVAFAILVAIANHPKTTIESKAYVLGNKYFEIDFKTVEQLIDALQLVDASLHAGRGLELFFKEVNLGKNTELLLITESSTLKNASMLKTINDHHGKINYLIQLDNNGAIDVYKRQQNSKKHIQHLLLPLDNLWKKKVKKSIPTKKTDTIITEPYPILFRSATAYKKILFTEEGDVFQITEKKNVLMLFNAKEGPKKRGWDLYFEKLPFLAEEYAIGKDGNTGDFILLLYSINKKEIHLINLNTKKTKELMYPYWSKEYRSFIFYDTCFYYIDTVKIWKIDLDGTITEIDKKYRVDYLNKLHHFERKSLEQEQKFKNLTSNVLLNVSEIYINQAFNLVFNLHELKNARNFVKFENTSQNERKISAKQLENTNELIFAFDDGSEIEIKNSGIFVLKSSNENIPTIFVSSALYSTIGIATNAHFAGNDYYFKENNYRILIPKLREEKYTLAKNKVNVSGPKKLELKNYLENELNMNNDEVDNLILNLPRLLPFNFSKLAEVNKIIDEIKTTGVPANYIKTTKNDESFDEISKMSVDDFFRLYIDPFIKHIKNHATRT